MTKRRIAILMHENDNQETMKRYFIASLSAIWVADGHQVDFLFGTSKFQPADVLIIHVDLSVVPEPYLEFARQFPVALNDRVRDIRKSTFSGNLLGPGDPYQGLVIVKSDLNYAGLPERLYSPLASENMLANEFRGPTNYPIYGQLADVPREYFDLPHLVVQKFEPEVDQGLFCVRIMNFLGNRMSCLRLKGSHPIVNGNTCQFHEPIEPHPEILDMRERLHFDYGKFDYVVVDGRAILLDVNKTVGAPSRLVNDPELMVRRHERARGLYDYFR